MDLWCSLMIEPFTISSPGNASTSDATNTSRAHWTNPGMRWGTNAARQFWMEIARITWPAWQWPHSLYLPKQQLFSKSNWISLENKESQIAPQTNFGRKLLNLDGMYTQFCFFFRSLRRSFRFHRMLFRQQQQHLLRIPDSRWQSASTTVCTHTHLCAIDRFFSWLKNQQARDCRASISLHLTHRRELTAFWFCCICSWAATNNRSSTHQSVAADRCFCYHMPKRIRHPSHQCRFEVRAFRYNNALGRYTWKLIEYVHVYTRLFFQCCYVPLPRCYYRTRTPAVSHQNI